MRAAALIALCCLAAGVQALAPASAGAAENQSTTCLNMPPQGFTEPVPGMGWDPVGGYACKLDSGGAYYGGTGTAPKAPTPTAPICTGRSCLPLGIGGGAGSGSGAGSGGGSGQRPGGRGPLRPGELDALWDKKNADLRKSILDKMTPAEQKLRSLLCAGVAAVQRKIISQKPQLLLAVDDYLREKASGKPGFKEIREMEAQVEAHDMFVLRLDAVLDAHERLQCAILFPPSPH